VPGSLDGSRRIHIVSAAGGKNTRTPAARFGDIRRARSASCRGRGAFQCFALAVCRETLGNGGPGGVLCSSLQFVGARHKREHQWAPAAVPPEGDADDPLDKRPPRPLRSSPEQPSAKMPQLSEVPGRKAQSGGLDPFRAGLQRRSSGTVPLHLRCAFAARRLDRPFGPHACHRVLAFFVWASSGIVIENTMCIRFNYGPFPQAG